MEKFPQSPTPENLESQIERLLPELDKFDFNQCSEEMQKEWYDVENETGAGQDRQQALERLRALIKKLEETFKQTN